MANTQLRRQSATLRRPKWAGFGMEEIFWQSLKHVCDLQQITNVEFVENAGNAYPQYPIGIAVRLQISQYLRYLTKQDPRRGIIKIFRGLAKRCSSPTYTVVSLTSLDSRRLTKVG